MPTKRGIILLDLDGVCADWEGHACALLDRVLNRGQPVCAARLAKRRKGDERWLDQYLGIETDLFWQIIDSVPDFWSTIPELPWYRELFDGLSQIGEVCFCTSPSLNPAAAAGKVEWIQRRCGRSFRGYILTALKYHCAGPNRVLVDDWTENCTKFVAAGGKAVIFPAQTNNVVVPRDKAVDYTLTSVRLALEHL